MKYKKVLLPIFVSIVCFGIAYAIIVSKPKPKKRKPEEPIVKVEAISLKKQNYQVVIESYGSVTPRTESTIIPQVAGNVIWISPNFRKGEFFNQGDTILKIDPRDFKSAIAVATAELKQAELAFAEEKAKGEQALRDWKRLKRKGTPSELVLRKPQLNAASAVIDSAQAKQEQAKRDLEKTEIKAPYDGRIFSKNVDVGQYVSPGSELARIFAVDKAEVRLPLNSTQLPFVTLPERYIDQKEIKNLPEVAIEAQYGFKKFRWKGMIVRSEGVIDTASRQTYVVAQVDEPYKKREEGQPPLKVGQFVTAQIKGDQLLDVITIPAKSFYQNTEVVVIKDGLLKRKKIGVLWNDGSTIVVKDGLTEGEILCITPMGAGVSGARASYELKKDS